MPNPIVPPTDLSLRDNRLLTRQEAADYLNVNLRFITRCVQERRIGYVRVGRMVRIPLTAITEYVESSAVPPLSIDVSIVRTSPRGNRQPRLEPLPAPTRGAPSRAVARASQDASRRIE